MLSAVIKVDKETHDCILIKIGGTGRKLVGNSSEHFVSVCIIFILFFARKMLTKHMKHKHDSLQMPYD